MRAPGALRRRRNGSTNCAAPDSIRPIWSTSRRKSRRPPRLANSRAAIPTASCRRPPRRPSRSRSGRLPTFTMSARAGSPTPTSRSTAPSPRPMAGQRTFRLRTPLPACSRSTSSGRRRRRGRSGSPAPPSTRRPARMSLHFCLLASRRRNAGCLCSRASGSTASAHRPAPTP